MCVCMGVWWFVRRADRQHGEPVHRTNQHQPNHPPPPPKKNTGDSLYRCKALKRAALGRMCTVVKKLQPSLAYLDEVRPAV